MIFDEGAKTTQCGKVSLFKNWFCEKWISTCKTMNLDPCLIPYTKINSKWTRDFNVRSKIIQLLEDNMGKSFSTLDLTMIS